MQDTNTQIGNQVNASAINNPIIERAIAQGLINRGSFTRVSKTQKSKLPGGKKETYVERKIREKKNMKEQKDLQTLLEETLDPKAPIKGAIALIEDYSKVSADMLALYQNQGMQEGLNFIESQAKAGDQEAKKLYENAARSIEAFKKDNINMCSLSDTIRQAIPVVEQLIENKTPEGKYTHVALQEAAKLDGIVYAANLSLATELGQSVLAVTQDLSSIIEYKQQLDNKNLAVQDAVIVEKKDEQ